LLQNAVSLVELGASMQKTLEMEKARCEKQKSRLEAYMGDLQMQHTRTKHLTDNVRALVDLIPNPKAIARAHTGYGSDTSQPDDNQSQSLNDNAESLPGGKRPRTQHESELPKRQKVEKVESDTGEWLQSPEKKENKRRPSLKFDALIRICRELLQEDEQLWQRRFNPDDLRCEDSEVLSKPPPIFNSERAQIKMRYEKETKQACHDAPFNEFLQKNLRKTGKMTLGKANSKKFFDAFYGLYKQRDAMWPWLENVLKAVASKANVQFHPSTEINPIIHPKNQK
jgi:hypothetical protein